MSSQHLAYLLARITLGINFLLHGLVRIPKLQDFATGMASGFQDSWMPVPLAEGFGYILPFVEALLGILILLGFKTKEMLAGVAILIILLIFGSGLKEDWGAVATQMLYALYIFFMLVYLEYNKISLDNKLKKQ